ncbi:MAG: cytochrome c [Bacillaceae bacterium]|nr:cytochrome c [Bacillaceae bacterium]
MKKNPLVPYAMIAILGIVAMVILSGVGLNQMDEVKNQDENQEQQEQGGAAETTDPEEIFSQSCAACHGADLAGGAGGPALNDVGGRLSKEEIQQVINNGRPGTAMPGGLVSQEQAEILAQWLSEHK